MVINKTAIPDLCTVMMKVLYIVDNIHQTPRHKLLKKYETNFYGKKIPEKGTEKGRNRKIRATSK